MLVQSVPEVQYEVYGLISIYRIEDQYAALKDKCNQRKGKLDETLALYKLYNEVDMVNTWVKEHVSVPELDFVSKFRLFEI